MIKEFSVSASSANDFVKKVTDSLSTRELGKIASISLSGENVIICFSKLGKSEVIFTLKSTENGFQCIHKSEKISFTHKAFRSDIENKLSKVLESNGAIVNS
ncbi:hypothetical protein [Silvanigrella aquatica]|uniref:Uncharacterized protein n=1 Tax=Silvanigrella aquatica TaxID=1915309 RepID=A0A1L4CZT4_9BACT|nr:hypothetical protein [Silvanigrella aquatica]APJ03459.1 hypothetical protein AXG55_05890 [Silvanigrella aquatica]